MNWKAWLAKIRKLAEEQSKALADDEGPIRAALAETYRNFSDAPARIQQAYEGLEETDIQQGTIDALDRMTDGDLAWVLPGDLDEAVLSFAVRLRALDERLSELDPQSGPASNPAIAYLCDVTQTYVIPRFRPRRCGPGYGGRTLFARRATVFHYVIPAAIGDHRIDLARLDVIAEPQDLQSLGAAMFDHFKLVVQTEGKTFRAVDVEADLQGAISDRVDTAIAGGCTGLVFPELTMPVAALDALKDKLAGQADEDTDPSLQWVMAGSWHVGDGPFANVAELLDRYGDVVGRHSKTILYRSNALGIEGFDPSFSVLVLMTADALIAFGICKDFCHAGVRDPYAELDVDLIVVSSMGDTKTLISHRANAHDAAVAGKRVFIVQQEDETKDKVTGWVLPPVADPGALQIDDMCEGPWSVHEWRRNG